MGVTKKSPKPLWPKKPHILDVAAPVKRTFAERLAQARWMKGSRATWLTLFHADLYASMSKAGITPVRQIWLEIVPLRRDDSSSNYIRVHPHHPLSERVQAFAIAWFTKYHEDLIQHGLSATFPEKKHNWYGFYVCMLVKVPKPGELGEDDPDWFAPTDGLG